MNTWRVCGSNLPHLALAISLSQHCDDLLWPSSVGELKTSSAKKVLAHETVRGSGVVLITTATFRGLCAANVKGQNVHQSVEMIRCGQVLERVAFGDLKRCLTNRTFDRRLQLPSREACMFVETLEAE